MAATSRLARLDSRDAAHAWLTLRGVRALRSDSRAVESGDAFVAWPGAAADGRRFVADAFAAGAVACLVEADGVDAFAFDDEPRVAAMRNLKAAAGEVASRFLSTPSARVEVIAVTGTNGKTSTAWWIAQALKSMQQRCGVVGTLGIGEPPDLVSTGLTTPDPITLQNALRDFADRGVVACAIEASSIGIAEHRLAGTRVAVAVFTNFTQDHLDYHGDMAAYWQAKAQLFAWTGLKAAVVNLDDAQGVELASTLASRSVDAWTVSARGEARLRADGVRYAADGLAFDVVEGGERAQVATPLIGDYNVSNLLSVIGVLRALGVTLADATNACSALTPVPGRMQRVGSGAAAGLPEVVVDYAHTPDALEKALAALQPLAAQRGGVLWCVFGCGGNRDAGKRPLMGAIARRLAGRVVVTSDNPRLESPDFIISQILAGTVGHDEVDVIPDRAEAIKHAVASAAAADIVLVAGKGHEDYQDAGGVKQPFSDARHAEAALAARTARASSSRPVHASASDGASASTAASTSTLFTLGEAARLLPGARLVGDPATPIARVHSDTRTISGGDLFVALRGERFDGHDFLVKAAASGAVAALAEHGLAAASLAGLEVADTRVALGQLAAAWRRLARLPLVAVTGSNGKTTVTQMVAAIFRAWQGDAALSTQGNFNNDIGVPLTLLRLRGSGASPAHRVAVVELGMNHPGEIARLAAMAAPTVALVNNAQREHLEFMVDVEAVARENGAVIEALGADGVAVFPADDAQAPVWQRLAGDRRVVTFGLDAPADVGATTAWQGDHWRLELRTPAGTMTARLRMPGLHNVRNALAATACALAAGCPLDVVATGLDDFSAVRGRSQLRRLDRDGESRLLVDDSYNANPDSVRAAIDVLADLPAPRWLVLGDMGEVGDQGPAFHREVGAYARQKGIDALWAAGPEAPNTTAPFPGARAFADAPSLVAALVEAPAFASVLVKGSRFMAMERVVAALTGQASGDAHAV